VKLHGGSIRATNASSGGLIVEIRLPISSGKTPAQPAPVTAEHATHL